MIGNIFWQRRPSPRLRASTAFIWAAAALLAGCHQSVGLRGTVVDVRGEALPGVAVTVHGANSQSATDGLGRYGGPYNMLRSAPGLITLDYLKTGYTAGHQTLEVKQAGIVDAPTVALWPLPANQGVYLFQDYRYQELSRTEAKRFLAQPAPGETGAGGVLFGTKKRPECETSSTRPEILCYRLPAYDIGLYRLEERSAAPPLQSSANAPPPSEDAPLAFTETIWAPARAIQFAPVPIDEPERLLVRLELSEPLAPGVYAVHWGALEGHTTTDTRIFLFRVAPPPEETG